MTAIQQLLPIILLLLNIPSGISVNFPSWKLYEKLTDFDVVHEVSRQRQKRSLSPEKRHKIEEIRFDALGRHWRLILHPSETLLDPHFRAVAISDKSQKSTLVPINVDSFLNGRVFGEEKSYVRVTVDEEAGSMLGQIQLNGGRLIMLEPAYPHIKGVSKSATLVYEASKLRPSKTPPTHFCGAMRAPGEDSLMDLVQNVDIGGPTDNETAREKRQTENFPKRMCPLKIVADYQFFRDIGDSRAAFTVRYLINLIDRVNDIYTTTNWASAGPKPDENLDGDSDQNPVQNMTGFGFSVREIVVKDEPNEFDDRHYNHPNPDISVEDLLAAFTKAEGSPEFCLVHLFTSRSFSGGVLGLSYIASARLGTGGGVCSSGLGGHTIGSSRAWYNTALSTLKSTYGDSVVTREADIVTAHELGHNWGSLHDPIGKECSPSGVAGGSYIMHTYSVSGYDKNNKIFSPCSKRAILQVLRKKSQFCFEEPQDSYCGNQRVERGEQCDSGFAHVQRGDRCCIKCQLMPGAKCSPANNVCCGDDCQFASENKQCLLRNENECHLASYCLSGGICPPPAPVPDGRPCLDGGKCQGGKCVPYCVSVGLQPCICENVTDSCYRCCRKSNGFCTPVARSSLHRLKPGTRCIHGYCDTKGECQKEVADVIEHLWKIFEGLDGGSFWGFVQKNLVGCVVIISIIIWVPASGLVYYVDEKRKRERGLQRTKME